MPSNMNLATKRLLTTKWKSLSLPESKQAAVDVMAHWDRQERVPEYTEIVMQMDDQSDIQNFMFNVHNRELLHIKKSKPIKEGRGVKVYRLDDELRLINFLEAVTPVDPDLDLEQQLHELTKRMEAARKGLGIANKMGPRSKAKHRSRVMANLNQIRGALTQVIKQLEQFDSASSDYETGRGYEADV